MLILVFISLDLLYSLLVEVYELSHTVTERFHTVADFFGEHLAHDAEIGAVSDVAHGSDHLKLGSTLIDGENTGIAQQALSLVLHDESGTTVNADAVVGVLVGILRSHTLAQRCEGIGQTAVFLHLLALLGSELTFA